MDAIFFFFTFVWKEKKVTLCSSSCLFECLVKRHWDLSNQLHLKDLNQSFIYNNELQCRLFQESSLFIKSLDQSLINLLM